MGRVGSGVEGGAGRCSHVGIRLVEDGPRRQSVGGERVVDGNGNAAGGQGPTLDQLADVSFEGEMTPLMLRHVHPIHPLQTQGDMGRGEQVRAGISGTPSHEAQSVGAKGAAGCHPSQEWRNKAPEQIRQASLEPGHEPQCGA